MATSLNQDDYLKTALRLPRRLHTKIQEAGLASGRSMNAEIVARLERSFTGSVDLDAPKDIAARAVEVFEDELKKGVVQALNKLLLRPSAKRRLRSHLPTRPKASRRRSAT
jgi:hypothetical protein